jgi:hypothetical protein
MKTVLGFVVLSACLVISCANSEFREKIERDEILKNR